MSVRPSLLRRVALRLVTHAGMVLPAHRADWAKAITDELHHVTSDSAALGWAIGCVFASYTERMQLMGSPHVSRWVLSLEMLVCFVPMTLLCLAVISVSVAGVMLPGDALLYLSAAAIGPIGLIVSLKVVVLKQTSLDGVTVAALCVSAAWTVLAFSFLVLSGNTVVNDWWREFVLMALLPAIGAGHLAVLVRGHRLPRSPGRAMI